MESGETLFRKGERSDGLYRVRTGRLVVTCPGPMGQELLLSILGPKEWFGEVGLFEGGRRSASVKAIETSIVEWMPTEAVRQRMRTDPRFGRALLSTAAGRVRRLTQRVEDQVFLDVPTRLARTIVSLCRDHGEEVDGGVCIALPLSQSDLGALISATRESVNKHLQRFARSSLLRIRDGQLVVTDLDRLARLGDRPGPDDPAKRASREPRPE